MWPQSTGRQLSYGAGGSLKETQFCFILHKLDQASSPDNTTFQKEQRRARRFLRPELGSYTTLLLLNFTCLSKLQNHPRPNKQRTTHFLWRREVADSKSKGHVYMNRVFKFFLAIYYLQKFSFSATQVALRSSQKNSFPISHRGPQKRKLSAGKHTKQTVKNKNKIFPNILYVLFKFST